MNFERKHQINELAKKIKLENNIDEKNILFKKLEKHISKLIYYYIWKNITKTTISYKKNVINELYNNILIKINEYIYKHDETKSEFTTYIAPVIMYSDAFITRVNYIKKNDIKIIDKLYDEKINIIYKENINDKFIDCCIDNFEYFEELISLKLPKLNKEYTSFQKIIIKEYITNLIYTKKIIDYNYNINFFRNYMSINIKSLKKELFSIIQKIYINEFKRLN